MSDTKTRDWREAVMVSLLMAWAFFSFASPIDTKSNDFWWHLALGRAIVEQHTLGRLEIFSHTLQGHPFVNFEWLFDALLFIAWKAVKIKGLIVMKGLFLTGQMGLLYRLLRSRTAPVWLAVVLCGVWIYFLRFRDYFRPEIVTFTGLILTGLLLERLGRERKNHYALTAVLFALWANLHGGFILGLTLLGCRTLAAFQEDATVRRESVLFWVRHTALAVAVCCLNPYGWKILTMPFEHMAILQPHRGQVWEVAEWKVPNWGGYRPFWLWAALVLAVTGAEQFRRRQLNIETLLVLFLFGASATRYARNIHPFVLVSIPLLACPASDWLRRFSDIHQRRIATAALAACFLFLVQAVAQARKFNFGLRVVPTDFPSEACRFLRESGLQGNPYNTYSWGGYLLWRVYPRYRVFMDSRYLFVPLLKEEYEARQTPEAWEAFLSKYRVAFALVPYPRNFSAVSRRRLARDPGAVFQSEWMRFYPPERWALVYWDPSALVFVRRDGPNAGILARAEYRFFRPDNYLEVDRLVEEGKLKPEQVVADIQRNIREVGLHPAARFFRTFFASIGEKKTSASAPAAADSRPPRWSDGLTPDNNDKGRF